MARSKLMSLEAAAALVPDGATITIGGGQVTRVPAALLRELARQGRRGLKLYKPPSGYDISATAPQAAGLTDVATALSTAPASSPTEFAGIGSLADASAEVVNTAAHAASWQSMNLKLADAGLLHGTHLRLSERADAGIE